MPTNLRYTECGDIDMLVEHPVFGLIPFTASPNDCEAHGRDLFARAKVGEFGPVAAYVAPVPALANLRVAALATLPAWEAAERSAGIDHAGRKWLTTPAALQDIRDALMAEAAPPGGVWIDASRQPAPMTLADLKALWGAIFARGAAIYQRRLEMEQAIATMPRAGLEAFKPGWPAPKP